MRILIVEDDKSLADGLTRVLADSGYAVDHAASGELALRAAREEHYDVVILDLSLPGIDGFEVLRQLRKSPSATAVLILTARDALEDRVRGLDLGADDYLIKPFDVPEFEARVRALIRRGLSVKGAEIRVGNLAIDTVTRRARIADEALELTVREWSVLEYLLRKAGQVVSKDQMVQALCNWQDDLTPNAIEVYVSRLRAKLRNAGVRIRTVRGFGYLVEEADGEH